MLRKHIKNYPTNMKIQNCQTIVTSNAFSTTLNAIYNSIYGISSLFKLKS